MCLLCVKHVCKLNRTISSTFFKYFGWELGINSTALNENFPAPSLYIVSKNLTLTAIRWSKRHGPLHRAVWIQCRKSDHEHISVIKVSSILWQDKMALSYVVSSLTCYRHGLLLVAASEGPIVSCKDDS